MGHVDNNPKPIARTHNHSAEICQTALHRVFGLDVAQFIRPVVNQLQMAHAIGDTHFVDALDLALEKIGPLSRDYNGRPSGRRRAQRCGIADNVQLLLLRQPQQPYKGCLAPGVKFSRFGRTDRMDSPVGKNTMGWRIGDNGKASDGKTPSAHWFCHWLESVVVADEAAGVAMHVYRQRTGEQLPSGNGRPNPG